MSDPLSLCDFPSEAGERLPVEGDWVSALLCVWNGAATIGETLDSIAAQSWRPIEIVVVNDGSTDDTRSIVERWAQDHGDYELRVRLVDQQNRGLMASRNVSVAHSRGRWIQIIDADDLVHREKFSRCVKRLRETGADVVVPRTHKFTDSDRQPRLDGSPAIVPWSRREIAGATPACTWWHSVGPIFRGDLVREAGSFPEQLNPTAEEMEFHARIKLQTDRVVYCDEILNFYRVGNADALTGTLGKVYRGRLDGARALIDLLKSQPASRPCKKEWRSTVWFTLQTFYQVMISKHRQDLGPTARDLFLESLGQLTGAGKRMLSGWSLERFGTAFELLRRSRQLVAR